MRSCHNHEFTPATHSKIGFGEAGRCVGVYRQFSFFAQDAPNRVAQGMIDICLKQAGFYFFSVLNQT